MINFLINNLEMIRNLSIFLVSVFVSIGLVVFYFKVFLNFNNIKEKNKIIEKIQKELDDDEIDNIKGTWQIGFEDTDGSRARRRKGLEQKNQKLEREKKYLLEEISIFQIFKK